MFIRRIYTFIFVLVLMNLLIQLNDLGQVLQRNDRANFESTLKFKSSLLKLILLLELKEKKVLDKSDFSKIINEINLRYNLDSNFHLFVEFKNNQQFIDSIYNSFNIYICTAFSNDEYKIDVLSAFPQNEFTEYYYKITLLNKEENSITQVSKLPMVEMFVINKE